VRGAGCGSGFGFGASIKLFLDFASRIVIGIVPRSDWAFLFCLPHLAATRFFGWLGDCPIAHVFPMGFGCKWLIIMFLVFLVAHFSLFFWVMCLERSGAGSRLSAIPGGLILN